MQAQVPPLDAFAYIVDAPKGSEPHFDPFREAWRLLKANPVAPGCVTGINAAFPAIRRTYGFRLASLQDGQLHLKRNGHAAQYIVLVAQELCRGGDRNRLDPDALTFFHDHAQVHGPGVIVPLNNDQFLVFGVAPRL